MDKVLESEDRVMRGGRSLVDRADPVTLRWWDLDGSVMGRSALDA